MAKGNRVLGWWAIFPQSGAEPRCFVTKEDATDYWPDPVKEGYAKWKVVCLVHWDGLEKNELTRTFGSAHENPLTREDYWYIKRMESEKRKQAKAGKPKAKTYKRKEALR